MGSDNIAQDAADASQLKRAMDFRIRGMHWDEIAQRCGYPSAGAALRAVGKAMAEATQRAAETADQMRDTANLQLDMLLSQAMDMMDVDDYRTDMEGNPVGPDPKAIALRAIDEARRLVEAKAKLNGVDRPAKDDGAEALKIQIVGIDPSEII